MTRNGLDSHQISKIHDSEEKIWNYIQRNGLVLFEQIVKESEINDRSTIRKRLTSLIKNGKVSSSRLYRIFNKNKGREYYYSLPISSEIKTELVIDSFLNKINNRYYEGLVSEIPIYVQYSYKLYFLFKEFKKLKEKFQKKSNGKDFESITHFEQYQLQFFADLQIILNSVIANPDLYYMFKDWYDEMMKKTISKMDIMYKNYKTLLSNKIVGGPIKTLLLDMMIENTKSGTMKKFGLSPKIGSKIYKELINDDGPNVEAINKNNLESIGLKEFGIIPSGETLMKKWKEIQ